MSTDDLKEKENDAGTNSYEKSLRKSREEGTPDLTSNKTNVTSGNTSNSSGVLSSSVLKNKESGTSSNSSDVLGKGYSGGGKISPNKFKAAANLVNNHKKGFAAGGGGIGLIIMSVVAATFLIQHELITLEKDLIKYEAKVEQYVEKKAAQHLFQHIICSKNPAQCGKGTDSTDAADETVEPESDATAKGEQLQEDVSNIDLADPEIEQDLAHGGLKVTTNPDGSFDSIENSAGENVSSDVATNDEVMTDVESGLPEIDVGEVSSLVPLEAVHAGDSFVGPSDTADDNVDKSIETETLDGASSEQIAAEASAEDSAAPEGANPTAAQAQAAADGASVTANNNEFIQEADAGIEADLPESQIDTNIANKLGDTAGSAGGAINANQWLSDGCSLDEVATDASKSRVPEIMQLLDHHFSVLASWADSEKDGKITSSEVSGISKIIEGDPSAPDILDSAGKPQPNPAKNPFNNAAEYQSSIGGSGGIPISGSSKPTANAGTGVVNDINAIFNHIPGGTAVCKIENSTAGGIIGTIVGLGVSATGILDFGLSDAATLATNLAVQLTIKYELIPEIVKYFTPVGLDGLEDAVDWTNNAGAGTNIAYGDYARRMGANPVTSDVATKTFAEAAQVDKTTEAAQPWTDRFFAISNPDSIVSKIALSMPLTMTATLNSMSNYFTNVPTEIMHDLASVFIPRLYAAAPQPTPGEATGITQYEFTDNEINKYDPILNEQYLFKNIHANGNTMTRISMLGNPNTYLDSTTGDTNNNDLMHCYVDSFVQIYEDEPPQGGGQGASHWCDGIGDYDYTENTPSDQTTLANNLDNNIIQIYATALCPGDPAGCVDEITPQVNDDIGHYRQYLLDMHVMDDYMSLTNNK